MKLSSVFIAALGVTCSALEETNQVRTLKGGKGGKSAGKSASKKSSSSPTVSLAPTLYMKSKKSKSSANDFVCPFGEEEVSYYSGKSGSKGKRRMLKGGKSGSKSKGKSSEVVGFPDAFPDGPGSSILIVPEDETLCMQAEEMAMGAALIMDTCEFSADESFKVDRFGRLHASTWSLCVQGDGGDLVLGPCDSCSSIMEYDEDAGFISPSEDTSVVFTAEDGAMNLQAPARRLSNGTEKRDLKKRFFVFFYQIFLIILFHPAAPTSSPAPTASLAPA